MDHQLLEGLLSVQKRLRQQFVWRWLAVLAVFATMAALALRWGPWQISRSGIWWFVSAIVLAVAFVLALAARRFTTLSELAHRIERAFPELQQRLMTAVAHVQQTRLGPRGYLETAVLQQTLRHRLHKRWSSIVPSRLLALQRVVALLGLLITGFVVAGLFQRPERLLDAGSLEDRPSVTVGKLEVVVEPGDADVERGTPLVVSARFPRGVPREATLWIERQGAEAERLPMRRNLADPLFAAYLPQVNQPAKYRIEFAGGSSEEYQLTVFEYPALLQADATLDYPDYTQLPNKQISDTRRVSAVEGSRLTWTARLNKPVESAWLEDEKGNRHELAKNAKDPQAYHAEFALEADQRWTLHLRDDAGRSNQAPPELVARVLINRPPELKPLVARDVSVSPLEELTVSASAWDDFGILRYGIAYAVASSDPHDQVLGQDVEAQKEAGLAYELNFESLDAQPDQLLAYHFWVEDVGPDGQPRRTRSDIYFADVRPFEEIFREGQSPPGGGSQSGGQMGGNAQQADELLEVNKQIISATWNLLRRETGKEVTDAFDADTQLVVESQQEAIGLLTQLEQRISDDKSRGYVDSAREHMNRSLELLSQSSQQRSPEPLKEAISAQQSAHQSLLQLRAREHEVVRGSASTSASAGAGGSARQQQIQQLELNNDVSRYETQQSAAPQSEQEEAAREMRQILSRLRDLARRQQDINKQLRDLQTALQKAQTEEEREEIERQLKRLRDQQEQMLRDTDDAQERMDRARNQRDLQQVREQLQQSRDRVQQSSQAASEGNVAEALAAGTRAERQFGDAADQLRRQTANQFTEEVEQLRDAARDLESQQEKIGQAMRESTTPSPGLRPDNPSDEVEKQLAEQRERLKQLTDQMQQTIRNAETAEPLLAQKLYDAYRQATQQQVNPSLQNAQELLKSGFRREAAEQEAQARAGITQLREDVEEAASAILGDEVEGLRRAAGTLAELVDQLQREIDQFDGNDADRNTSDDETSGALADAREAQRDAERRSGARGDAPNASDEQDPRDPDGQSRPRRSGAAGREGDGQPQDEEADSNRPDGQRPGQSPGSGQEQAQQDQQGQPNQRQEEGQGQGQGQGQQQGQRQGEEQQPSERQGSAGAEGQSQGQGQGQGQGQAAGEREGQGEANGGRGQGQRQSGRAGDPRADEPRDGDRRGQQGERSGPGGSRGTDRDGGGGLESFGESLGSGPITGESFTEWSDRLRDVEEMVTDADIRSRAAQIRDRARSLRRDMRRQSESPRWDLVRELIATPLDELRQRVEQELVRRSGEREQLVPVDRDPVPSRFEGRVRHYYEQLGQGE